VIQICRHWEISHKIAYCHQETLAIKVIGQSLMFLIIYAGSIKVKQTTAKLSRITALWVDSMTKEMNPHSFVS